MPNTQVTLAYTVTLQPPMNVTRLVAILGAVPLNADLLAPMGCAVASDTTVQLSSTSARRTIVVSFFSTSLAYLYPALDSLTPFVGTVVSSSPNDKRGGSGCQLLRIDFLDARGKPNYETVEMAGTAPVAMVQTMGLTVSSMAPLQGTPAGLIVLSSGPRVNGVASGQRVKQILNNFTGTLLSTSDEDKPGGTGATSLLLSYTDALGNPHTETVVPNGKRPVTMANPNKATMVSIAANHPNIGTLSIYTGDSPPPESGAPAVTLPPSFQAYFPDGTDQTAPFWDLFTSTLAQGVGSKVVAAAPVLA